MENGTNENYLGIDWGQADLGLALADGETRMAFGYDIIKNDKNLLPNLAEIVAAEGIGTVIIGVPSHFLQKKDDFGGKLLGEKIENELGIKIYYQDEGFTTKMAQSNLIEKGEKNVGKFDDKESARIILQEWLDKNLNY